MFPLNSKIIENYSVVGDVKEVTQYYTLFGEKKVTKYQNSTGKAISETENVSKDDYGQVTHVTKKEYKFDASRSQYDTEVYNIIDVTNTYDSNGYGQLLNTITQSGNNNGLNSYYDEYLIYTYNGPSHSIPDTITEYIVNDTNNVINVDATYQYGKKTIRTFNSVTQNVTSESTSVYNLTTSERYRALNDVSYTYDLYGNLTRVIGTTYNNGLINEEGSVTTESKDQYSDIEYSYNDLKNYHVYQISTTVNNLKDIDGNYLKNSEGISMSDISSNTTYNLMGQKLSTTDGNGAMTQYVYNNVGDVQEIIYPDNTSTVYNYNYNNCLISIDNADGTGLMSRYDVFGNLTDIFRLNEDSTYTLISQYYYDDLMRNTSKIDYLSVDRTQFNQTVYVYDFMGRTISTTVKDQNGIIISQNSTDFAQAVEKNGTVTDSVSNTVSTGVEKDGISTDNCSTAYTNASGNTVITETNISGSSDTTYTNTITYSGYNTVVSVDGETTTSADYYYDEAGNIQNTDNGINVSDENSQYYGSSIINSSNYNGSGNVSQTTNPNIYWGSGNNSTVGVKYFYDALGRTIEIDTPFDGNINNESSIIYSKEKTYYDAAGNVVETKKTNNAIGETESYTITRNKYDNMGNLILQEQVVNETESEYTQYYYDSLGRLRRVYSSLSQPLTINGLDEVVNGTDIVYSTVKYEYDFQGRLISYTDALNKTETYQYYDITGLLFKKTERNGNVITYTYDNAGNVTQIEGKQSGKDTLKHIYTYDLAGNILTAKEINVTTNTVNSDITYTYDSMNRCLTESYSENGDLYKKEYTYNANNVTDFELYKNNASLPNYEEHYEYFSNGKLSEIYYDSTKTTSIKFGYDNNNNIGFVEVKKITDFGDDTHDIKSDNKRTAYKYNLANLCTEYNIYSNQFIHFNTIDGNFGYADYCQDREVYQYSLNANLISKEKQTNCFPDLIYGENGWIDIWTSTPVDYTEYSYDGLNRLINEKYGQYSGIAKQDKWEDSYLFKETDAYGYYTNKVIHTDYTDACKNTTTENWYNRCNQLELQEINLGQSTEKIVSYDYDNAGNLIKKENLGSDYMVDSIISQYSYDTLNRMSTTVMNSDNTINYKYNAIDQRTGKITDDKTTVSVWNGNNISVDYVTVNGNTTQNSYIAGNHGQFIDGVLYANTVDGQGNVVGTTQYASGTGEDYENLGSYTAYNQYDAYGNVVNGTSNLNPMAYRGQYYDSETGLYYLQARYYDPSIQQFTQEDTYWGDGTNLYSYCHNNPVLAFDPTGHSSSLSNAYDALGSMYQAVAEMSNAVLDMYNALEHMLDGLILALQGQVLTTNGLNMACDALIGMYQTADDSTATQFLAFSAQADAGLAECDSGFAMTDAGFALAWEGKEQFAIAENDFNIAVNSFYSASNRFDAAIEQMKREAEQEKTNVETNQIENLQKSSIDSIDKCRFSIGFNIESFISPTNMLATNIDFSLAQITSILSKSGVRLTAKADLSSLSLTLKGVGYASILIEPLMDVINGCKNGSSIKDILVDSGVDLAIGALGLVMSTILFPETAIIAPIAFGVVYAGLTQGVTFGEYGTATDFIKKNVKQYIW